ncbi:hypothetical protein SJ05684_b56220 (plasmid) [Sinorhizobium sojae CCBAU 05684]|uniref:Uncharacterized protein n=1 Tax=Sinorhizobium sojae CCBAU 05684 TaxID=716928 RepID=A0A249PLN9_9HYPH|nr:hypothetical protein SJ05684_b56220 [Sinorhizobium sojae CCBAU 05684]
MIRRSRALARGRGRASSRRELFSVDRKGVLDPVIVYTPLRPSSFRQL